MNDILQDFQTYLLIEKGLSRNTSMAYIRDLSLFFEIKKKNFNQITIKDIQEYLHYLNTHYASASIQRKVISLRQFFSYLYKEELIKENPLSSIDLPKAQKKLPSVLSIKDIAAMLHSLDIASIKGMRDYCMISLLISSGIRVSELINVKTNDFSEKMRQIKIIGKGNKERIIPLDDITCKLIHDYLNSARLALNKKKSVYIFLTEKGEKISRENFYRILSHISLKAGIKASVSPHKLRHTYATTLLEGGADLRSIQELLGHSNLVTTTIYTHIANEKLVEDYNRFHPGNRKKVGKNE